jgi:hypothetical protein
LPCACYFRLAEHFDARAVYNPGTIFGMPDVQRHGYTHISSAGDHQFHLAPFALCAGGTVRLLNSVELMYWLMGLAQNATPRGFVLLTSQIEAR